MQVCFLLDDTSPPFWVILLACPSLSPPSPGVNVAKVNSVHHLRAFGGEDGFIECFDPRQPKRLCRLDAVGALRKEYSWFEPGEEISSLCFALDGLSMAVGTRCSMTLPEFSRPCPRHSLTINHLSNPHSAGHTLFMRPSGGTCGIFDLRQSLPVCGKEHQYQLPIHSVVSPVLPPDVPVLIPILSTLP